MEEVGVVLGAADCGAAGVVDAVAVAVAVAGAIATLGEAAGSGVEFAPEPINLVPARASAATSATAPTTINDRRPSRARRAATALPRAATPSDGSASSADVSNPMGVPASPGMA
jgi:hypothetical protein